MATPSNAESEIQFWLETVLKKDNVKDVCVNILGNSEKGDGYMGDIVFVSASANLDDGSTKEYNLVLKCSKRSKVLRETSPAKEAFKTEISFYEKILPKFTQFQKDKGIEEPFDSVPKYYGSFVGEDMEVIILENLKKNGYELWPKKRSLTRKHIDMVVKEYGKFHAISLAMREQQPNEFKELVDSFPNSFKRLAETSDMQALFGSPIDESYELLKNDLDENVMLRWRALKDQINFVFNDMIENLNGMKVITHSDCWNNNFMYLSANYNQETPVKVAMLDWQMIKYNSPILDLSYFLFSCISAQDLENLDNILYAYHQSLTNYLRKLGTTEPQMVYPYNQFMNEWKNYSKYGAVIVSVVMKICSTDNDEILDVAQAAESGKDFSHSFLSEIRDTKNFKERMRPIVEFVVKHDLI